MEGAFLREDIFFANSQTENFRDTTSVLVVQNWSLL